MTTPANEKPFGCKCTSFSHHLLGDGCDECNPEIAERIAQENAEDEIITNIVESGYTMSNREEAIAREFFERGKRSIGNPTDLERDYRELRAALEMIRRLENEKGHRLYEGGCSQIAEKALAGTGGGE